MKGIETMVVGIECITGPHLIPLVGVSAELRPTSYS